MAFLLGAACPALNGQSPGEDPPVAQWIADLQGENRQARREAVIACRAVVREHRDALLPVLVERLRTESDGQVRFGLLDCVTELGAAAEPAVPALVESLRPPFDLRKNDEPHQIFRAAMALASIGPAAVGGLKELLGESSVDVRAEAAMALGRIGPPAAAAIETLVGRLTDDTERVRHESALALGAIGDAAVEPLLNCAESADDRLQLAAIEAIAASPSRDPRLLAALEQASRTANTAIRAAGIGGLAAHGIPTDRLREILRASIADGSEVVRLAALNVLVGRPEDLRALQPTLSELLRHEDAGVARHAAFLIPQLGDQAALELLESASDHRTRLDQLAAALARRGRALQKPLREALRDADPRRRQVAILALGQIRPVEASTLDRLAEALDDPDEDVQRACLMALRELGPRASGAAEKVSQRLNADAEEVRLLAVEILFHASAHDDAFIDQLVAMVTDPSPQVQQRAIELLKASGPVAQRALPAVLAQLSHAESGVRTAAAEMIASYGSGAAEAVNPLLDALDDHDAAWQLVVIRTIGRIGQPAAVALDRLAVCMGSEDALTRVAALDAIANLGIEPARLTPLLQRGLEDSSEDVRRQSLRSIRRLGKDANVMIPALIRLSARGDDAEGADRALERIESYGVPAGSVPELVELLKHTSPKAQLQTVKFLGLAGPAAATALPQLEQLRSIASEQAQTEIDAAITRIRNQPTE